MKLTTKKSQCIKSGAPLFVTTKKAVQKKLFKNSTIQYCVTVEPFPMAYAYSEKMSTGDKFVCDTFSLN